MSKLLKKLFTLIRQSVQLEFDSQSLSSGSENPRTNPASSGDSCTLTHCTGSFSSFTLLRQIKSLVQEQPDLIQAAWGKEQHTVITQILFHTHHSPTALRNANHLLGYFLKQGADPSVRLSNGRTPLIMAVENENLNQVRIIIEHMLPDTTAQSDPSTPSSRAFVYANPILCKSDYLSTTVSKNVFGLLIQQKKPISFQILEYLLNKVKVLKILQFQELIQDCIRFNNPLARQWLTQFHKYGIIHSESAQRPAFFIQDTHQYNDSIKTIILQPTPPPKPPIHSPRSRHYVRRIRPSPEIPAIQKDDADNSIAAFLHKELVKTSVLISLNFLKVKVHLNELDKKISECTRSLQHVQKIQSAKPKI